MSLDGSEAFFYSSLTNTQGVDSQYVDLGGVSGVLKGVNDQIQGGATTDDLPEGKVNLYFTDGRAQGAFTSGTGIVIATGTISNTGVLSLTGTNNRISVSGSTGNITLNLPQDINTTSSPQFAGLTLGTLSGVLKATAGVVANGATTDDLTEGKTNLYFTNNRARAAITASAPIFITGGIVSIGYNTSNLKLTGSNLDTIQDINTTSSPQFIRLLNSSLSARNVLYGTNSGTSITTGVDIVAIGNNALTAISTAGTSTAVGSQALRFATGGSNTGLGFYTLRELTTGNQNTAVGTFSGSSMTTASFNTLIGQSAGFNITTGNTNFCLGLNAGYSITSSADNITIGAYSMAKNLNPITVTNGRNIAIGHYASHSLAGSPANNITIGYQSLFNATSCSDNICIGTNTGNAITTGGGNICIGGSSTATGGTLTNGQGNNIGIGIASNLYVSGNAINNIGLGAYSNFNTSTGNSNISIGQFTQASNSTSSNEITISTNGTISFPVTGRGPNTCLIDARAGLHYYATATCFLYAYNFSNNRCQWANFATNNPINNFTLGNYGNGADTVIIPTIPGLYQIDVSGTVLGLGGSIFGTWNNVNIRNYTHFLQSFSTNGIAYQVGFSVQSRPYFVPSASGFELQWTGATYYGGLPIFVSIRFISL